MELPSILFFSISYLISSICCCIGGILLLVFSTDEDYSDHSLPLSVAIVINNFICLSVFTSSTYAFLFRPAFENQHHHTPLQLYGCFTVGKGLISILCAQILIIYLPGFIPFSWIILSFLLFAYLYYRFAYTTPSSPSVRMYLNHSYCWGLLSVVFAEIALPVAFPGYLASVLYLVYLLVPVSFSVTYIAFKERFGRWGWSSRAMYVYRRRKILEFAVGMVSSILFQYTFRVTSIWAMVGFFCIAAAWLGNLAMVQPSTDLGIFNFLVVNVCLSWAVTIFKLNQYTWLVFGACLLLLVLRWKLDSVTLRYNHIFSSIPTTTTTTSPSNIHPTMPITTNDHILSTTESSLQLTLSNQQPPLLPPTILTTQPPARAHSF